MPEDKRVMDNNQSNSLIEWLRTVAPKRKEGRAPPLVAINMDGLCFWELNAKINEAADALETMREALAFYADRKGYDTSGPSKWFPLIEDEGAVARKALESSQGNRTKDGPHVE